MPADMNQTVYEEAKRCRNCLQPGKHVKTLKGKDSEGNPINGKLEFYECETEACKVHINGGTFMVQIRRDGTIPVREVGKDKQFQVMDSRMLNRASSLVDQVLNPDTDDAGRPEIDNPWSPR